MATRKPRRPPLPGALVKPALLSVLRQNRAHGYVLVSALAELGIEIRDPARVYRLLHDMEKGNLIRSEWQLEQRRGPPRRVYTITAKGRRELVAWETELEQQYALLSNYFRKVRRQRDAGAASPNGE